MRFRTFASLREMIRYRRGVRDPVHDDWSNVDSGSPVNDKATVKIQIRTIVKNVNMESNDHACTLYLYDQYRSYRRKESDEKKRIHIKPHTHRKSKGESHLNLNGESQWKCRTKGQIQNGKGIGKNESQDDMHTVVRRAKGEISTNIKFDTEHSKQCVNSVAGIVLLFVTGGIKKETARRKRQWRAEQRKRGAVFGIHLPVTSIPMCFVCLVLRSTVFISCCDSFFPVP